MTGERRPAVFVPALLKFPSLSHAPKVRTGLDVDGEPLFARAGDAARREEFALRLRSPGSDPGKDSRDHVRNTTATGKLLAMRRQSERKNTMETVQIVGATAAVASVLSFTPQAWRIIRDRSTEGLSVGMYALTVFAFACWMTFGIMQGEWALIIPNAICLMFAAFILVMIALPPKKTADVSEALDPTRD